MSLRWFIVILVLSSSKQLAVGCFKAIISFGDSLADTGNLLHLFPPSAGKLPFYASPPYGETFFHHPTGRFSDGRLMIDFFAPHFGLPLVQPFYGGTKNFNDGVNFAVGSAAALPDTFYVEKGVEVLYANVSLMDQLSWFKNIFLPNLCHNPADCREYVETSLVLMGEIGGNDYNHAFYQGKSLDEIQSYVPKVVKAISLSITELIKHGAVTIMVPGNFPIGCWPIYLTNFNTPNQKEYDPKTGCLNWLNTFAKYHNNLLQSELRRIRLHNPRVTIIYADYYNIAMRLFRDPQKYGFDRGVLRACCGGGGPYNVNKTSRCGYEGSKPCENPSSHVHWDGIHLTEAAYKWIANTLLQQHFTAPPLISVCAPSNNITGIIS